MNRLGSPVWLLAGCSLLASPGCAGLVARTIARAPRHGAGPGPQADSGPAGELRVDVGPPPASLSTSVIEPAAPSPPRGTVFILHGWKKDKSRMLRTAGRFLERGYRAVLVDLRGHGRSSGDWMTYGVQEARDLAQVLDALEAQGRIARPVGVFGISYGAAAAILWAARDPRLEAVVSVAAFSSLRAVVPRYVRLCLPVAGWFLSEARIQAMVDGAGQLAGFDPGEADPARAIPGVKAPVLLIHGRSDFLIPPRHALALKSASRGACELLLLDGEGHNSVFADRSGAVARESLRWFDRRLDRGGHRPFP